MAEAISTNRTVTPNQAKRSIRKCVKIQRPVFMWGPPGIGKSDIVKHGLPMWDDGKYNFYNFEKLYRPIHFSAHIITQKGGKKYALDKTSIGNMSKALKIHLFYKPISNR